MITECQMNLILLVEILSTRLRKKNDQMIIEINTSNKLSPYTDFREMTPYLKKYIKYTAQFLKESYKMKKTSVFSHIVKSSLILLQIMFFTLK